jgi:uncharacterized MAPEG superfamily protein
LEQFDAYAHAIVSVALVAMIAILLAPLAATQKAKLGLVAGATPDPDYSSLAYRCWRAHLNATETMGTFAAVTFAAILAGAAPFWVNLFASLFFASRAVHAFVHVCGIGAETFGVRTFAFVFGSAMCLLIALTAIVAAF